jgi:hypothetical protein
LFRNKICPLLIFGTVPQDHTVQNPQPGTPAAFVVLDPSHWLPVNDGLPFDLPSVFPQPVAPL